MAIRRHDRLGAPAIAALLALSGLLLPASAAHASSAERVRFHVLAVEERSSTRTILSEANIDGPPGTDFEIELRGGRFKMTARFLTDSIVSGALAVKAKLETRRLYGRSERGLPLYEEDSQTHDLTLDLDEQLILLPFGSPAGDQRLKVEITPTVLDQTGHGANRPDLEIDILKRSEDGAVNIRAFRVPHRFVLHAVLLRQGVEVARANGRCVIEGTTVLSLDLLDPAGRKLRREPLRLSVDVDRILRERPTDLVSFGYRLGGDDGSGIAPLGLPLEFKVTDPSDPGRKDHVLRLTVDAAETD